MKIARKQNVDQLSLIGIFYAVFEGSVQAELP
jgi:hypothetical protein